MTVLCPAQYSSHPSISSIWCVLHISCLSFYKITQKPHEHLENNPGYKIVPDPCQGVECETYKPWSLRGPRVSIWIGLLTTESGWGGSDREPNLHPTNKYYTHCIMFKLPLRNALCTGRCPTPAEVPLKVLQHNTRQVWTLPSQGTLSLVAELWWTTTVPSLLPIDRMPYWMSKLEG